MKSDNLSQKTKVVKDAMRLHLKLSNISNFAKDTKLTKHTSFKSNYLLGERSDHLSLETKLIVNALLLLK